jgi:hypothetical protein
MQIGQLRIGEWPMASVETIFAVDSTGFVGNRFVRWYDIKYRGLTERVWAKAHFMCGVETRIITDVVIEDRDASDLGQLPTLLNTTVQNFTVKEVLADKVYNVAHNQEVIAAAGAEAFIPFKKNHTGREGWPLEEGVPALPGKPGGIPAPLPSAVAYRERDCPNQD